MENDKTAWNRREFLGAAGLAVVGSRLVRGAEANPAIRVGLLGCGGRGTADATSMVKNAGARVTALGDLFQDQLDRAKRHFDGWRRSTAARQSIPGRSSADRGPASRSPPPGKWMPS